MLALNKVPDCEIWIRESFAPPVEGSSHEDSCFIQLHWIERLSFGAFDLTLYVLVDLRWILVSKPLSNGLLNGLRSSLA